MMYAVGVYDMRPSLLDALTDITYVVGHIDILTQSLIRPFEELLAECQTGNIPEYIARERFLRLMEDLQEESWYLGENYSWTLFLAGQLPEFGIDGGLDGDLGGWNLFLDSHDGIEDYEDGDEDDPFQLVQRSKAKFIALYGWYQHGYLYVLRSPAIQGGTPVDSLESTPEGLLGVTLADPLRPEGGVPCYALTQDILEVAEEVELQEEDR